MPSSPSADRFHALDATRAFALLLGVVFHAAWSFVPRPVGAPIVDHSSNVVFDWFFFTSHSFRMQVFFLIAGFFARLLYLKRGWIGFAQNRFSRIAVPMVIGWFIFFPLATTVWTWGANLSGRNLVEVPIPVLFQMMFEKGLMFVPRVQGGLFGLTHLWFLYYLLYLYVLALALRALLIRALPKKFALRERADRIVAYLARSPWSLVWLTVATALFLWPMEGWFGVDTPTQTLTPSGSVLILYGTFFALGWLLHRQAGLLQSWARHWKWQLTAGLVVSLVCFAGFRHLMGAGYIAGATGARYPSLWPNQIVDGAKFAATLKSAESAASVRPKLANFWQRLPAPVRRTILQLPAQPSPDVTAGICVAINNALILPGLFVAGPPPASGVPTKAEAELRRQQHRATLEELFDGAIIRDPLKQPSYWPFKLAYSLGYALMTWLLVFGTLGFFQARFPAHSAAWRYAADSAYWIYLIHLPLVACLQVWMGAWRWPATLKFALLLGIAFVVLFATYHYFVRSTFIGKMLNGQRYPFTRWPFGISPGSKLAPPGVMAPAAARD